MLMLALPNTNVRVPAGLTTTVLDRETTKKKTAYSARVPSTGDYDHYSMSLVHPWAILSDHTKDVPCADYVLSRSKKMAFTEKGNQKSFLKLFNGND